MSKHGATLTAELTSLPIVRSAFRATHCLPHPKPKKKRHITPVSEILAAPPADVRQIISQHKMDAASPRTAWRRKVKPGGRTVRRSRGAKTLTAFRPALSGCKGRPEKLPMDSTEQVAENSNLIAAVN